MVSARAAARSMTPLMLPCEPMILRRFVSRSRILPSGFSLIELVVLIAILAILSVSAVPVLRTHADARLAAAFQRVRADINFARQYSVSTGTRTWVLFDIESEQLSLFVENPGIVGRAGRQPMASPDIGGTWVLRLGVGEFRGSAFETVDFADGVEVGFDFLGRPLIGDDEVMTVNGTVTLAGGYVLTIEGGTGYVR